MESYTSHSFTHNAKRIHYLTAGPSSGPLLIFVHGWPGLALTWKPQLQAFSALGYFCVAADTQGYGKSSNSDYILDYSCPSLVDDQLTLLAYLKRTSAVWIGHDWGSPVVWSLATHHPEVCLGVVNLCVPYRTLELGVTELLTTVNREIHPEEDFPNGQWDYQVYYEKSAEKATAFFDADIGASVKLLFVKGDPAGYCKPARTASIIKSGGWCGGVDKAPDIPLSNTVLDAELHQILIESLSRNGFWAPTAYYLNHEVNREYNLSIPEDNKTLKMPVLFIEARWDHVCATSCSNLSAPMRKYCPKLTEVCIEAGHWVGLERPGEVNVAVLDWLQKNLLQPCPRK